MLETFRMTSNFIANTKPRSDWNQSAYIWSEEVLDPVYRTFKSQSSNQEDGEDGVRQCGGDVNSLE